MSDTKKRPKSMFEKQLEQLKFVRESLFKIEKLLDIEYNKEIAKLKKMAGVKDGTGNSK